MEIRGRIIINDLHAVNALHPLISEVLDEDLPPSNLNPPWSEVGCWIRGTSISDDFQYGPSHYLCHYWCGWGGCWSNAKGWSPCCPSLWPHHVTCHAESWRIHIFVVQSMDDQELPPAPIAADRSIYIFKNPRPFIISLNEFLHHRLLFLSSQYGENLKSVNIMSITHPFN